MISSDRVAREHGGEKLADLRRTAGMALVAGFLLVIVATFVTPPGLIRAANNAAQGAVRGAVRLEIIAQAEKAWIAMNAGWALGALVTAAGFLLLTRTLRRDESPRLTYPGAAAFALGGIALALDFYLRTIDPAAYFALSPPPPLVLAFFWLTEAGLILYGIVFLRRSYPRWLGSAFIYTAGFLAAAALIFSSQFYGVFPPQIFYLLTAVAGTMLMGQS